MAPPSGIDVQVGHDRQGLGREGFVQFDPVYNSFHYLRELSFDFVKIDGVS